MSSGGGVLLLRQVDRKIKLPGRPSKILDRHDDRQEGETEHGTYGMLVQRVFGSWHGRERKVVAKAEYNEHSRNPRFVLPTREGDPCDIL